MMEVIRLEVRQTGSENKSETCDSETEEERELILNT